MTTLYCIDIPQMIQQLTDSGKTPTFMVPWSSGHRHNGRRSLSIGMGPVIGPGVAHAMGVGGHSEAQAWSHYPAIGFSCLNERCVMTPAADSVRALRPAKPLGPDWCHRASGEMAIHQNEDGHQCMPNDGSSIELHDGCVMGYAEKPASGRERYLRAWIMSRKNNGNDAAHPEIQN